MDFKELEQKVMQYLEKLKTNMLTNPRGIHVVLRKLDMYVDSFHYDVRQRFEQAGRMIHKEDIKFVQRPNCDLKSLDRIISVESIRRKLESISNQLLTELANSRRYISSLFSFSPVHMKQFIESVEIIVKQLDEFQGISSSIKGLVFRINTELEKAIFGDLSVNHLHNYFEEIRSPRVIGEFEKKAEDQVQEIMNNVFKQYEVYFTDCLRKYEAHFRGRSSTEDFVVQQDSQYTELPSVKYNRTDMGGEPPLAYLQNKVMHVHQQIEFITIGYQSGSSRTIKLSSLDLCTREEMEKLLAKLSR